MLEKDLYSYAEANWVQYKDTVSEISKNERTQSPLVKGTELLFNFDDISDSIYSHKNVPASADAIRITPKCVELIEFKSGF